jgi:hypothetical protein
MAIDMQQPARSFYSHDVVLCTFLVQVVRRGKLGKILDKLKLLIVLMLLFIYFHLVALLQFLAD